MCDESKRAEKPEAQAAVTAAPQVIAQVKPQGATRKGDDSQESAGC